MSVSISPYSMQRIEYYEINRTINEHDTAIIRGEMSELEYCKCQNMLDSSTILSVYYDATLIFAGEVTSLKVLSVGQSLQVELLMKGITFTLDMINCKRDYQNIAKTLYKLIDGIFEGYKNINYKKECKDETIEKFLVQYEETDYAFLCRLLADYKGPIYTQMTGDQGRICLGLKEESKNDKKKKISVHTYEISYEPDMTYIIHSNDFLDVAEMVQAFERELYIKKIKLMCADGVISNTYYLAERDSMSVEKIKNNELIGVSFDGEIKDRQRDKVQIELNGMAETLENERRWFSYASPASSSDGGGWYCMPEIGEEIRLYFPTEDESEAYVISAIKSGNDSSSGGEPMDSANKILSNAAGQSVSFTENGVAMNCADGTSMTLNPEGTIEIFALNDVNILSDSLVKIKSDNTIDLNAGGKVTISTDTGASIEFTQNILVNANRIKNNG